MSVDPMTKLQFAFWAISRILWLAAVVVFSLALPLLSLAWLLNWWERRRDRRPPSGGSQN